jgi:hypothetical protein
MKNGKLMFRKASHVEEECWLVRSRKVNCYAGLRS